MKCSVGAVLAVTLALTYPVQSKIWPLNGRVAVPAVNEADSSQDNVASHKKAVTKLISIRDEASMTVTVSSTISPSPGRSIASTQRHRTSQAPNEGQPSKQSSAAPNNGAQDTKSTGSTINHSNQPIKSDTPARSSNPNASVTPEHRSDSPDSLRFSYHPSNAPTPSGTPNSTRRDPSEILRPSQDPSLSQTPSQNPSETPAARSSEPRTSKIGGSSETNAPHSNEPRPLPEKTGSDFAKSSKTPEKTDSPSATPTQASSNPDSAIESSMMPVTTGRHTTTEPVFITRTTVKVTKGQQTSSVVFTATSVTTSKGSKPTAAWGCVLSEICGSGTTNSGGGSVGGCIVPLLCPSDHNWGLGGGWSPSGNPSPGGPSPPPSTPKTPSDSGSEDPNGEPEKKNTATSDDDKKTTTTDKTTSSTKTSTTATTTSTSASKLRLCMSVVGYGTATTSSEATTSSKATTTSTSASKLRLCMSVVGYGTATTSSEATTSSKTTATSTSASKLRLCMSVVESGSVTTSSDATDTTDATPTISDKKQDTITSAPTTFATTTKAPESLLCRMSQDPAGPTSCICTSGTTETMLPTQSKDGRCGYSKLPEKTTTTEKATTDDAPAQTLGPVTSTTTNDEFIIWPSQTIKYSLLPGTKLTETYPAGDPTTSTETADTPKQTGWSPKGSSICGTSIGHGLKTFCEKAWENYDDKTVYTKHTQRHDSNSLGMGCTAEYTCSDDSDYTPGLTGKQLKGLFAGIYDNSGIKICGSSKLSNGCTVSLDYCDECKDAN